MKENLEELIKQHWEYIRDTLLVHGHCASDLDIIEFHI